MGCVGCEPESVGTLAQYQCVFCRSKDAVVFTAIHKNLAFSDNLGGHCGCARCWQSWVELGHYDCPVCKQEIELKAYEEQLCKKCADEVVLPNRKKSKKYSPCWIAMAVFLFCIFMFVNVTLDVVLENSALHFIEGICGSTWSNPKHQCDIIQRATWGAGGAGRNLLNVGSNDDVARELSRVFSFGAESLLEDETDFLRMIIRALIF